MKLSFTPREAAILLDRLTVPDCIADALTDTHEDDPPAVYTRDEVEAAATRLWIELEDTGAVTLTSDLDRDVMHDAVDGSCYFSFVQDAYNDGDWTRQQVTAAKRNMLSIEKKLAAVGITASFA